MKTRECFALALIIVSAICFNCSTESQLLDISGSAAEAPVFLSCRAVSATELSFQFSKSVRIKSLSLNPPGDIGAVIDGITAKVHLNQPYLGGERIVADMLVEDDAGNTLSVLVPIRARNDNIPPLVINEVRTEYAKPRVEFLEFKVLGAGNLGALRLFIAGKGLETPFYEFPPANVKAGDYVTLHLRSLDSLSTDEIGPDLGESPSTKENEARPDARDFWYPDTKKPFASGGDAVFLMDQDDTILDALVFCDHGDPWWSDEKLAKAAEALHAQGAWKSRDGSIPSPADAVLSRDATPTRTLSRDEDQLDSDSPSDWYVVASSSATPGRKNSVKRHIPQERKAWK